MMSIEDLEAKAEETLRETDAYRVPVPIETVAQRLNLTMEAFPLGNISGLLIVKGDQGAMGYNSAHARVRQRIAISHEIAHFVLHARRNRKAQLFLDRHLMFRDDRSVSAKADREEVEANRFGSALLMPKGLVQKEIRNRDLDLDDDDSIELLAKKFWVSQPAMANRLLRLGMLLYPAND
jgi:Zn-dependent peptidase ImmA (M78 family)